MKRMRSSLSCLAVIVATLAIGVPASAQTVDEIIARNLQAKGGEELLRSTTSVRTAGSGTMQGQKVTVRTTTKRPSMMRNETSITVPGGMGEKPPSQTVIQAFDGENLWVQMGSMPPQTLPPGEQVEAVRRTSQIDSPLLDYKAKGTTITLGEPSTEGGRKLHHLVVTPKGAPAMHYYIDAETNLESRMVIDVDQGGQKMRMEMRFGDFKTIAGRTVPTAITQFMNGTQLGQIRFDSVEFNVPVEDDLFRLPKK
jgi:outer membrane lipoprotein-sorting protein